MVSGTAGSHGGGRIGRPRENSRQTRISRRYFRLIQPSDEMTQIFREGTSLYLREIVESFARVQCPNIGDIIGLQRLCNAIADALDEVQARLSIRTFCPPFPRFGGAHKAFLNFIGL